MVKIRVWSHLGTFEKLYTHIIGLKTNEEALEKILLKDAKDAERQVYHNLKEVEPDIMRDYAKSAVNKLDSEDRNIKAYGTGEIRAFREISCYIGMWIDEIFNEAPFHRWLYKDPQRVRMTKAQKKAYKAVLKELDLQFTDYKAYEAILWRPNLEQGLEDMRKNFEELNIAFWDLE